MNMMPGQAAHPMPAPAQPHGPSPLIALLMHHAQAGAPAAPHMGGMAPQAAGAPLPLGQGGHAAPKFGHAPAMVPGQ